MVRYLHVKHRGRNLYSGEEREACIRASFRLWPEWSTRGWEGYDTRMFFVFLVAFPWMCVWGGGGGGGSSQASWRADIRKLVHYQ